MMGDHEPERHDDPEGRRMIERVWAANTGVPGDAAADVRAMRARDLDLVATEEARLRISAAEPCAVEDVVTHLLSDLGLEVS